MCTPGSPGAPASACTGRASAGGPARHAAFTLRAASREHFTHRAMVRWGCLVRGLSACAHRSRQAKELFLQGRYLKCACAQYRVT